MANSTTTQASYITVDPQADECRENVPPRDPKADDSSKLENAEIFTLQLKEDGVNAFVSSTPASKNKPGDFQAKSLLSGVQYSITPVLKRQNIWNKSASPEPFKLRNSPNPAVPSSFYAANCQKSTGDSKTQKNGEDFSMINDECLPEVTLSDLTSDSVNHRTMNDSVFPERHHATPQLYAKKINTSEDQNSFCTKVDESFQSALSFRGIFNDFLPDISLLEVTQDSPVGHMSFMDMEDGRATSDHSDQIMTEKSDTITIEELSSTSGNSAQSSRQNSIKAAVEVTQDVTLENSKSSSESGGQKVEKFQNPNNGTQVINITRDLCSSCDAWNTFDISSSGIERSTHEVCPEPRGNPDCIEAEMVTKESQRSPGSETGGQNLEIYQSSDIHCIQAIITPEKPPSCDTSVQTAHLSSDMDIFTPELESEPKEKLEELPTLCETGSTNKESQQTLTPDVSANGTFTVEQPSMQTVSFVNNETLDLLPTNVSKAKDVEESGDQQTSVNSKTEASFVVHQSSSDEKKTTFAIAQNATVDGDALQKSKLQIGSALEKTPAPFGHLNGTFDYKLPSQLNGTITLAEISSNDSHQSGLGSSCTSKERNATITLKDGCSENNSSKLQTNEAAEPETKKNGSPNMTNDAAEPETKKNGSPNMTNEAAEPETRKNGSPNMTNEAAEPETKKNGSPNMTNEAAEPETKKNGSPNMTNEAAEPETKKNGSPNMTNEAAEPETKKNGSPNMTNEAAEPETKKNGSPNMTNEAAEPETKKNGSSNMTFDAPLQPTKVSMCLSQSGLSDFDESLDLGPHCLATSTPMVSNKMSTFETKREAVRIQTAQKKLYGKTPIEPSNTIKPSNIIGDRKTFFKQPTAKIPYPASKIASELLKRNPPAAATGLLVKRQRPDGEAAKSSAAPKEQENNSSSYNLRSLASKLPPPSGLQRPQVSGIPVGLPRPAPSLRAAPCSSTEKPGGPAAAISVMKMAPGKRHPLAKGDALPVSKRKKTEASTTEAPVSVGAAASEVKPGKQPTAGHRSARDKSSTTAAAAPYDVISRGKGLKQPAANPRANHLKPQSQGCNKCEHLLQEVERLKEVLRKHKIPLNG